MTPGSILYRLASYGLSPLVPALLARRLKAGKEDPARLPERLARSLPERPSGELVWMHGASVGECQILLGLAERMAERAPGLSFLITSQTLTSARLVASRALHRTLHQMAPVDTPGAARRFMRHWQPDLAVLAEGEIWPNLIGEARRWGCPLALVNARMTERSRKSWARWPGLSRRLFGAFDLVLPADEATGQAISALSGRPVAPASNLKRGLAPPMADPAEFDEFRSRFVAGRKCLLAASTHEGEESLFLEAAATLGPDVAMVIAPRHPERGPALAAELERRGLAFSRRSAREPVAAHHRVLLADTIGEMGLWYRLADLVFLGGASRPGIGGHNPIEPLQLHRPVITGPHGFNFEALFAELCDCGLLTIVTDGEALARAMADHLEGAAQVDFVALEAFLAQSAQPLREASKALLDLMKRGEPK